MVVLERKLSFHRQIAEPVAKKKTARRESKCGGPFDRRPRLAATRPRPEKMPFRQRWFGAANFQRKKYWDTARRARAARKREEARSGPFFSSPRSISVLRLRAASWRITQLFSISFFFIYPLAALVSALYSARHEECRMCGSGNLRLTFSGLN